MVPSRVKGGWSNLNRSLSLIVPAAKASHRWMDLHYEWPREIYILSFHRSHLPVIRYGNLPCGDLPPPPPLRRWTTDVYANSYFCERQLEKLKTVSLCLCTSEKKYCHLCLPLLRFETFDFIPLYSIVHLHRENYEIKYLKF